MTLYRDTRGNTDRPRTFTEALLDGIAPGGGLYVPERLPQLTTSDLARLATLAYAERAASVFAAFDPDIAAEHVAGIAALAYGDNFDDPEVAPVRDLGDGRFVLELWHGPTLAFKDMALQCMPLFFSEALELAHARGTTDLDYLVLVATSGDTGVAALNGFADRAHTRIAVSYPRAGVSAIQQRQMTTQPGDNLTVFAVEGDFDTCQSAVKAVFDDRAFAAELAATHRLAMSSANSINWGRLLPQIVYYVSAYADLAARGQVSLGAPIDVCVPTGNFGDILAGYYAKRMGVPVRRLLCASNTNRVLTDFIATGVYDIAGRDLVKTPSPSMDILISNNLERLLYDLRSDADVVRGWMDELRMRRRFTVDEETHARLQEEFVGSWVDNDTCLATIGEVWRTKGYLIDPHTAVAWTVAERAATDLPVLVVSTAHWSKFAADVVRGLSGLPDGAPLDEPDDFALLDRVVEMAPGARVPASLEAVRARPARFTTTIAGDRAALERALLEWLEEDE
ncbi:MAG TPA: threonine synthase [Thermoleophilia bacterium]|nr:threonine synthase [Thermoleophilia bacterium]